MPSKRAKIHLYPLGSTVHGAQAFVIARIQLPWEPKADLQRSDGSGGVLVQHRDTKLFALWTPLRGIQTLPQRQVQMLLEKMLPAETKEISA